MASPLFDQLMNDIKTAMKSGEKELLVVLRTLHAQVKDATVNQGKEETDADVATVVAKSIKQRQDSVTQFKAAGRDDLANKELQELEWVKRYQPQQLSEAEVTTLVEKAIAECGATSRKDMGKVMQALQPLVKGKADGKLVSQIVQAKLETA